MKCLTLLMASLLLTMACSAEAGEKIRLTGVDLSNRISGYEVLAGAYEGAGLGFHFMVVAYRNGTRELYWNDGTKSGTDKGTHRVVGDQICVTWEAGFGGRERCHDVYKIGDNQYESYWNDRLEFTYYKIR